MKYQLKEGEWGGFINPVTFQYQKLFGQDLEEKTIVIKKSKEFIEDINRTIVKTEYALLFNESFIHRTKNEIKSFMAEYAIKYMDNQGMYPPRTTIKKTYKTSVRLLYKVDDYDSFEMAIKKDMIGDKSLDEYFKTVLPYKKTGEDKHEEEKKGSQTWKVEGSNKKDGSKNIYTVIQKGDKWTCTCPSFIFRKQRCKHIKAKI